MQRVICDTNVWYRIADGTFVPPANIALVTTEYTLIELVTSENILYDPVQVKGVIRAIYDYHKEIIPTNPFQYFLNNQSSRFSFTPEVTQHIIKSFEHMMSYSDNDFENIPQDLYDEVMLKCKEQRNTNVEVAVELNDRLATIQPSFSDHKVRKEYLKIDRTYEIQKFFLGVVNQYARLNGGELEYDHINWDEIELFISVTQAYFKKLETTPNMKARPNDILDWLNMVYVKPGEQYLTFEKSWKNYILSNSATKQYLYQ